MNAFQSHLQMIRFLEKLWKPSQEIDRTDTIRVTRPSFHESRARRTNYPPRAESAVWSPCNRFIAVARADEVTVDVLDSVTLQPLQTIDPHVNNTRGAHLLAGISRRVV